MVVDFSHTQPPSLFIQRYGTVVTFPSASTVLKKTKFYSWLLSRKNEILLIASRSALDSPRNVCTCSPLLASYTSNINKETKDIKACLILLKITHVLNAISECEIHPLGDKKDMLLCPQCPSLLNPCSDESYQNIEELLTLGLPT